MAQDTPLEERKDEKGESAEEPSLLPTYIPPSLQLVPEIWAGWEKEGTKKMG
jgi:hypothetical protein